MTSEAVRDLVSRPRALARRWPGWSWVALTALVLYLPWGGARDLWFPDEPDVAEPAMAMVVTGDWVVPRHNDEPWLDYPPLTYWLGAGSAELLGGPTPFALRLPVGLVAALLVVLTAVAVEGLEGREAGLWAGLTLATAPQFTYQAVNFHPDMAFAALVSAGLGLYGWGFCRRRGWRSIAFRAAAFACFGGAILAKGPLGLLLPGLILVVWHLSLRQWRPLLGLAALTPVALAVAAPWYLMLAERTSPGLVWREVYLQNFARFGDGVRGHEQYWHYYFNRIWVDWGPWSLLLPTGLAVVVRHERHRPLHRLAVVWLVTTLLFLTAATTKRQVYLLPAYPAIAFLVGREAARLADRPLTGWLRRGFAGFGGLAAGLGAASILGVVWLTLPVSGRALLSATTWDVETLGAPLAIFGLACLAGGMVMAVESLGSRARRALAATAGLLVATYLAGLAVLGPWFDGQRSYREATLWLRQESGRRPIGYFLPGAERKVSGVRVNDPAFLPLEIFDSAPEAARFLRRPGAVVLLRADGAESIAPLVEGWSDLPKRSLRLSQREFLALGPVEAEAGK